MPLLCRRSWFRDTYVKGMEKKYEVSFECIAEVGESLEHDGLLIQVTNKYVETLSQKLKTRSGRHGVPTSVADLKQSSHEQELPHTQHPESRSIIGVLLYLCIGRPDIQFATKRLTSQAGCATESTWRLAKKISGYLVATADYTLKLSFTPVGFSVMVQKQIVDHGLLETFSDADWAGVCHG